MLIGDGNGMWVSNRGAVRRGCRPPCATVAPRHVAHGAAEVMIIELEQIACRTLVLSRLAQPRLCTFKLSSALFLARVAVTPLLWLPITLAHHNFWDRAHL